MDFKREKVLPSKTFHIDTTEGTLHFTKCYQDEKLVEVRGVIGKNGTLGMAMLDTTCKLISILLQSDMSRVKIVSKLKKQFADMNVGLDPFIHEGNKYTWSVDYVVKEVIKDLS